MDLQALAKLASLAAQEAGSLIRSYTGKEVMISHKEDKDSLAAQVVTEVDRKAQDIILKHLMPTCEGLGIALLAEESEDDGSRFTKEFFWCIDPLDGTLPFVEGRPGYSVSIALVGKDGSPQIGVVLDPVEGVLWEATKGHGIRRNHQPWALAPLDQRLAFHYDWSFEGHPIFASVSTALESFAHSKGLEGLVPSQQGGAVLNACHVLEKAPGCYFRFPQKKVGGCSIWDFAATACLFQEAGAVVSDSKGSALDLNRAGSTYMNHGGAIFATDPELAGFLHGLLLRHGETF